MRIFNTIVFATVFSIAAIFTSCKKDNEKKPYSDVIDNLTDNIIVPTYRDLDSEAADLLTAIDQFIANQNETNLEAMRAAWRDVRKPWEQSEGFLFGPVSDKEIDPKIDSWPLNATDLDEILAGEATLNKTYIDGLDETLKGFHTIEYLLWSEDGEKTAAEFTARELAYLKACTESLKGQTNLLYTSWISSGDNFAGQLKNPGSRYPNEVSVLAELADGIGGIAGEVGDTKIKEPYTYESATLEESSFSSNSKADFADNIRSIEHIYMGTYLGVGGNGKGLSSIVAAKDPALDTKIKQQIAAAIESIESIEGTFSEAIQSGNNKGRASVEEAYNKVVALRINLKGDLVDLISKL